ncbi:MAG: hypothetical protein ABSG40_17675 [Terriglobales bacterium]|jgi:hypothetical protein
MINEGALQQFLVMAFEGLKELEQALTETNEEMQILLKALHGLEDPRIEAAVKQAREVHRRLQADSAGNVHAEFSNASEYDQIIQRLLNGEVC